MEKLHINVSAEGIRALDHLSAALNDMNGQMLLTLRQLREQLIQKRLQLF